MQTKAMDWHGFAQILRAEDRMRCVLLQITVQRADSRLWGGLGVALGYPWGGFRVALYSTVDGFVVALGWLCTPESMPSICLVYGFVVACGGPSAFCLLPSLAGYCSFARKNCLGPEGPMGAGGRIRNAFVMLTTVPGVQAEGGVRSEVDWV